MKIKIYQVDAFSEKVFSGNPAAVCPLDKWLTDEQMQNIAMENNLAETAFYVKDNDQYQLRWFTPTIEVDLCGHATLAAAFVLFNYENHTGDVINFYSPRSGKLTVTKDGDKLALNFPSDVFTPIDITPDIISSFNIKPTEAYKGKTDYMLVYETEVHVRDIIPDIAQISKLDARGVIITAQGDSSDFVSRFFAPQSGVDEDPVTGSAHTTLTPYWSKKLGKDNLTAIQLSKRLGYLECQYLGDRVEIKGSARLYLTGNIFIK
jgi:PhzF family phenazine biosynthesis protein